MLSLLLTVDATYYTNPGVGISASMFKQRGDSDFSRSIEYGVGLDAFVTELYGF